MSSHEQYSGEASPALSEAMDGYIQWVIAAQANANPGELGETGGGGGGEPATRVTRA